MSRGDKKGQMRRYRERQKARLEARLEAAGTAPMAVEKLKDLPAELQRQLVHEVVELLRKRAIANKPWPPELEPYRKTYI
jgi:hypothetical protein